MPGLGGYAQGDLINGVENVVGSKFADTLIGDHGSNRFDSGGGDDTLDGGPGGDMLNGGAGNDTASYKTATTGVTASLAHAAKNTGDAAGDTYNSIENLTGSAFADKLTGDGRANVLSGGPGKDTLTGEGGADTFYFATATEGIDKATDGIDKITDFSGDKIGLSQVGFNLTSLQDGVNFIADKTPTDKVAESTILYDTKTGALYWDPDGTGSQAPVEFATLKGHPHLAASDFLLMA